MTSHVSSSHMVETVMINVEDFSGNFLTCGTCYSGYNNAENAAKSLPCSHLICVSCIQKIIENLPSHAENFPCPHCRYKIPIPGNGPNSFPPAFIVNELLDLLASQRRDLVPKCRYHPNKELLFCETCDVVFCVDCRGRGNSTDPCAAAPLSSPGMPTSKWDHYSNPSGPGSHRECTDPMQHDHLLDDGQLSLQSSSLSSSSSTTNTTSSGAAPQLSHNVISFNVALKRCSEILLYKAHLCVQELNSAQEAVSSELERLDQNKELCIDAITRSFNEIIAQVKRRQADLLNGVNRLADEKHRSLTDQLQMIESERTKVRDKCEYLQDMVDVRSISRGISYLNDKLDTIASLTEPRENAYIRYQDRPNFKQSIGAACSMYRRHLATPTSSSACATPTKLPLHYSAGMMMPLNGLSLAEIAQSVATFGQITVSTTYPALCTLKMPQELVVNITDKAVIHTVDYHGQPQTSGTDPIDIRFQHSVTGQLAPANLVDLSDGSYQVQLRPRCSGPYKLHVDILKRPMRGSPFQINVRAGQKPRWTAKEGCNLVQPFAVAVNQEGVGGPMSVFLLDTGNSRLVVLDPATGQLRKSVEAEPFACRSATGMVWSAQGLWVTNWRSRTVYLFDPMTEQINKTITSEHFQEPTSVACCPCTGRVLVADNAAGCVFACEEEKSDPVPGDQCAFKVWPIIGQVGNPVPPAAMQVPDVPQQALVDDLQVVETQVVPETVHQQEQLQPVSKRSSSLMRSAASGLRRSLMLGRTSKLEKQASKQKPVQPPATGVKQPLSAPALQPLAQVVLTKLQQQHQAAANAAIACRKVNGLCVSKEGEIILAAGSVVQIYSQNGRHLRDLIPPSVVMTANEVSFEFSQQQEPSTGGRQVNSMVFPTSVSVHSSPMHLQQQYPVATNPFLRTSTMPFSSALDLHNQSGRLTSTSRMSNNRLEMIGRQSQPASKGYLGGVTLGSWSGDSMGDCLLATLTDRNKSVIVVWPEHVWRGLLPVPRQMLVHAPVQIHQRAVNHQPSTDGSSTLITPVVFDLAEEQCSLTSNNGSLRGSELSLASTAMDDDLMTGAGSSLDSLSLRKEPSQQQPQQNQLASQPDESTILGERLMDECLRMPYVLEFEPGLRRPAGLTCLPDARELISVDLGGQSLVRVRYA